MPFKITNHQLDASGTFVRDQTERDMSKLQETHNLVNSKIIERIHPPGLAIVCVWEEHPGSVMKKPGTID